MTALVDYGDIEQGQKYRVLHPHPDHYVVLIRGKAVPVFWWVFRKYFKGTE